MTYYEIVSLLDSMVSRSINESDIEKINNAVISLNGIRYDRFIVQMNYYLTERLGSILDNIIAKIKNTTFSANELALEMGLIKNEIELLEKLLDVKHIKDENREAFKKSLRRSTNNLYIKIKDFFIDEEKIRIIEQYIKEDEINEL